MKRPTYNVAIESEGERLATTTAHAWNSGLDKGRALLRDYARATGEPYTVHNADTVRDTSGIVQPWHGDKTGRIVYIVMQNAATEYPAATQARAAYGDEYGDYIQSATAEHVAKGHYSHEYAMSATLSDMLAGNNGA